MTFSTHPVRRRERPWCFAGFRPQPDTVWRRSDQRDLESDCWKTRGKFVRTIDPDAFSHLHRASGSSAIRWEPHLPWPTKPIAPPCLH